MALYAAKDNGRNLVLSYAEARKNGRLVSREERRH
jgi:hypothetical protein